MLTDHRLVVDALAWRLGREPDLVLDPPSPLRRVVAEPGGPPDIVVLDGACIGGRWTRTLDDLLSSAGSNPPPWRLVVLAAPECCAGTVEAVYAGASAWLPPQCGADEVIEVLRRVGRGEAFFPPEVLGPVLDALRADHRGVPEPGGPIDSLTMREREVLACLVAGWNGPAIATRLEMAESTVRTHTTRILRKLGVHSQVEAVRIAHEAGFAATTRSGRSTPASTSTTSPSAEPGPLGVRPVQLVPRPPGDVRDPQR